ncbi:response regulator [Paenibacillus qinlingensis]|uniref:Two-component system response regulator YesN n=1 Tax=Paenibacillus qinlingensis TaxID=1837343 RepID=A0ABU1P6Q5_9BACL|nr:response regulator [Paenibacillus qinlingensis]MDR6554852.1 two-component system response regulator YesN [Paenibacillus qinlingensis]
MLRVLIVDDEPLIRESLSSKVEQYSEETVVAGTAANGAIALKWLDAHYADICLTDMKMPIMGGLELIGRVNERYPWMTTLVVSSYDEFDFAKSSMRLGALDYIIKPVDQQQLDGALARAAQEVSSRRRAEASIQLMRSLPHHQSMVRRWINQMQTVQFETLPLLVVDTLDMLESLAGERFYLLNPLSMAWLEMIVEELKKEKVRIELHEGKDLGLWEKTIPQEKVRSYFRLCAVRRLEEGAYRIFAVSKAMKDHPTRRAVEEVKDFVGKHYAEKLNLQEIADQVAISRNHFAQIFKQETGTTVWSYLIQIRMGKAREMLLGTDKKVYEIANAVGYDNSVHFSQVFKEQFGLTPAEFKKRMER